MNENVLRRTGLPLITITLALLLALLIAINETWALVVPIIGLALIIIIRPFWGLLLFALLIPLESSLLSLGGGAATVTRLVGIFVLGVWILQVIIKRQKILIPSNITFAIIFIIWGSMSIIWAFNQSAAIARMQTALQLVVLAILVVNMVNDYTKLKTLLIALFIGCFIAALLGLLGIGVKSESYLLTLQNQGAKEYGCYVGIVFLLGSILLIFGKRYYRWLGLAGLAFSIIPLFRVNERGIFLAIGLAWVVIALVTRQKVRTILFIVVIVIIMSYLPGFLAQKGIISTFNAERLTIQNVLETGGTGRTEIWGTGFRMFTDNLFIGTGWGNFPVVFNKYSNPIEIYNSSFSLDGKDPHGDLMGIAGELGLIGLLIFLVLFTKILFRNIATFWKGISKQNRILAIIVISLLVYIFSVGLTSTFLWRKIYWLILGMGIIFPMLDSKIIHGKPQDIVSQ